MYFDTSPLHYGQSDRCTNSTSQILDCTRYSKCKHFKRNHSKVLNFLREQPKATQKEIAAHIGKSERTVKTITVNLTERGIIERKNGKRNGFWEVKTNELNS